MYRHWLIRAVVQQALWHLPIGVRLNALLARHDPDHELREKHWPYLKRHLTALASAGFGSYSTKTVLEIGTGWDFDIALMLRLCGFDKVITADAFRHVKRDYVRRALEIMKSLAPELTMYSPLQASEIRSCIQDWQSSSTLEELQHRAGIQYLAPISKDYAEIQDDSLDLCYSTAVMEHIRPAEVRQILIATRRKLKPGGLTSHVVDLKDHFAYFQTGLPYNHFLRFSTRQWEWIAGNPMTYTNRLSASEWRCIFSDCGYEIELFEEIEERQLTPLALSRIHSSNKHWSAHDLKVGELRVIARRRE